MAATELRQQRAGILRTGTIDATNSGTDGSQQRYWTLERRVRVN